MRCSLGLVTLLAPSLGCDAPGGAEPQATDTPEGTLFDKLAPGAAPRALIAG